MCLVSVASLMMQLVCLHWFHTCMLIFCDGLCDTGTNELLTHLLESCFHFSITPLEVPGGSSFLTVYFLCLVFAPTSIYPIIIVTWIISDREELSFENQTPAAKQTQRKINFILIPIVHFISLNKLHLYVCPGVFSDLYEEYQHDLQKVKGGCEAKMSFPLM